MSNICCVLTRKYLNRYCIYKKNRLHIQRQTMKQVKLYHCKDFNYTTRNSTFVYHMSELTMILSSLPLELISIIASYLKDTFCTYCKDYSIRVSLYRIPIRIDKLYNIKKTRDDKTKYPLCISCVNKLGIKICVDTKSNKRKRIQ